MKLNKWNSDTEMYLYFGDDWLSEINLQDNTLDDDLSPFVKSAEFCQSRNCEYTITGCRLSDSKDELEWLVVKK